MSQATELDLQYSPSKWSKRYSAEEVIQKHLEFTANASDKARKSVPCHLDVPYGPSEREKMDIFGTDLPSDSPIFIYIHGGYWQQLSRDISSYVVEPLYKHKFKVIILGYTLCPQVTVSEIVQQIQKAFLKCLEYVKDTDSRALYIGGHSAGAHLTTSLFESFFSSLPEADQKILKGVFLISGVYDLVPLTKTYVNDPLTLDDVTARKLSPLYYNLELTSHGLHKIPFYIIVGENDSPAFIQQSKSFQKKLKDLDFKSELIVVNEVDHFDIVENLNNENYEITKLIISMDVQQ